MFRYSYAEFFAGNEEDNTLAEDDNSQVQLETLTVLVLVLPLFQVKVSLGF